MRLDKDAMIEKMQSIINKVPPKFYADILYDKISSINIQQSISGESLSVIPRINGFVFRIFEGSMYREISDYDLFNLEERVLKLIEEKPEKLELVLTGRDAHPELVKIADVVIEYAAKRNAKLEDPHAFSIRAAGIPITFIASPINALIFPS